MITVTAIAKGFYGGVLREPGTKFATFEVPEEIADSSPWWKRTDAAPDLVKAADELLTMSGMAKAERGRKRKTGMSVEAVQEEITTEEEEG